jgi:hypothetical protein
MSSSCLEDNRSGDNTGFGAGHTRLASPCF